MPNRGSFNEPDLGVDVGFTPEGHREMTKRIGAHLQNIGLKTKMLLGDTANPRDTHRYILPTAADPEAMRYVGAISFHSWMGATPEQYDSWAEAARWLNVPLIIGEAGVDPGAYRNRNYDSYDYGLREVEQTQQLLQYAQPQVSLYWQFTQDYGLAKLDAAGRVVPTGRFYLMKHFTNLTPMNSTVVSAFSDQADVLVSAFTREQEQVIHIANLGPARRSSLAGVQPGWRAVVTTEEAPWREIGAVDPSRLDLPARSLITLIRSP